MSPSDRRHQLTKMPVFLGVDEAGLDWLADRVTERDFAAGDVIIRQGDVDRDCFFLIDGMVAVEIDGEDVGSFGPLDPEGELALLYGGPRRATVTALGPCRTFVLSAEDYDVAAKASPEVFSTIGKALRTSLARRFGHPSSNEG